MKKIMILAAVAATAVTVLADNANPSIRMDDGLVEIGKQVASFYRGKTAVISGAATFFTPSALMSQR